MTSKVEFQASHIITKDDLVRWLAEYGVDIAQISDATIRIGHHLGSGSGAVQAWLDLDWYATDRMGCRYVTGNREGAAQGHSTIPLRSFPPLTPVENTV